MTIQTADLQQLFYQLCHNHLLFQNLVVDTELKHLKDVTWVNRVVIIKAMTGFL